MGEYMGTVTGAVSLLLSARSYLGSVRCHSHMKRFIFSRRLDGAFLINLTWTLTKLSLLSRLLLSIDDSRLVDLYTGRSSILRSLLIFAHYTGFSLRHQTFIPFAYQSSLTTICRTTSPLFS